MWKIGRKCEHGTELQHLTIRSNLTVRSFFFFHLFHHLGPPRVYLFFDSRFGIKYHRLLANISLTCGQNHSHRYEKIIAIETRRKKNRGTYRQMVSFYLILPSSIITIHRGGGGWRMLNVGQSCLLCSICGLRLPQQRPSAKRKGRKTLN